MTTKSIHTDDLSRTQPDDQGRRGVRSALLRLVIAGTFSLVAVTPVAAQSTGAAFCNTAMAETVKNLFTLIQFGGPLIGGVIALGATVATPTIRRADLKQELKEMRNQALIWGVIVAPLGTVILQFLLNNVVAGGASCGF